MSEQTTTTTGGGLDAPPDVMLACAGELVPLRAALHTGELDEAQLQALRKQTDPLSGPIAEALAWALTHVTEVGQAAGVTPEQLGAVHRSANEAQKQHLTALKLLRGVLDARLVIGAVHQKLQVQLTTTARARLATERDPSRQARLAGNFARVEQLATGKQADQAQSRDQTLQQLNDLQSRISDEEAEIQLIQVMGEVRAGRHDALDPELLRKAARTFEQLVEQKPTTDERRGRGR